MYAIGEFSEKTGLSVSTLRYYEELGLLRPARDGAARRQYDDSDLRWARFIRRLTETGMPLAQIRVYSDLRHQGDETLTARLNILQEHREYLKRRMRDLARNLAKLDEKISWYESQITSKS